MNTYAYCKHCSNKIGKMNIFVNNYVMFKYCNIKRSNIYPTLCFLDCKNCNNFIGITTICENDIQSIKINNEIYNLIPNDTWFFEKVTTNKYKFKFLKKCSSMIEKNVKMLLGHGTI